MAYRSYSTALGFIVDSSGKGDFTTVAAASAAATAGQNVFIKPGLTGIYTEDGTFKPGVNYVSYSADDLTPNVTIVGKWTHNAAGTVTCSGIRFQTNNDYALVVSGSVASSLRLKNCSIISNNHSAISFTSSSASAFIQFMNCNGDVKTTGINWFDHSSAGQFDIQYTTQSNSGASTTPSTCSAGSLTINFCRFAVPITMSGTGTISGSYGNFTSEANNATPLTLGGGMQTFVQCQMTGGTASAASISTTATFLDCVINSSNTNAVTGAGTLNYSDLTFVTSSVMNVTTQSAIYTNLGKYKASGQPCFSAYSNSAVTNQSGDGTAYTIVFGTELFDLDNNFDGTSTFTAPVTGKYHFSFSILSQNNGSAHNPNCQLVTTANSFTFGNFGALGAGGISGNFVLTGSVVAPMTAGDTAVVKLNTSGSTKTVGVYGAANDPRTTFSGYLVA